MISDCTNSHHGDAASALRIGPHRLRNAVFLAPMSGVSDVPFRRLAWRFGAGMVVSEMVASEAVTTGQQEMRLKMEGAGLPLHMVQLAGRQAHWMAEATRLAQGAGADIIDINMGCPSKRVTTGYSGSALMRDLDHALTLVEAVVEASQVPVTLKMRLGWDENSINAPELAQRAVDAGVQMITVHGRTRNQFYKGVARWEPIADVRERIEVPLIVNGDISDHQTALTAMRLSGADGVMIGRASYGAPWICGQVAAQLAGQAAPAAPFGNALGELVTEHYAAMLSHYGVELGLRNARKHLGWYCGHLPAQSIDPQIRRILMTSTQPQQVLAAIAVIFGGAELESRAA